MFGTELSKGRSSLRGRIYYFFLGHDQMGIRVRFFHFKRILEKLEQPKRILDAGCGDGAYSFYLSRRYPTTEITGVDIAQGLIEECNYILQKIGRKNLRFKQESLEEVCEKERFDLIYCIDVLPCIFNDKLALLNLRSAIKPGGTLVIHVPVLDQPVWIRSISISTRKEGFVRVGYDPKELMKTLERCGFYIVSIKKTFGIFGALTRDLSHRAAKAFFFGQIVRLLFAPAFIFMAYLDSIIPVRYGQGVVVRAMRPG